MCERSSNMPCDTCNDMTPVFESFESINSESHVYLPAQKAYDCLLFLHTAAKLVRHKYQCTTWSAATCPLFPLCLRCL